MPSAEENYLILWCVIEQKMENGTLTKIDWNKVATKMGSDNVGSTVSRWNRLKADFKKMGFMEGDGPVKLEGVKATAPRAPAAPKEKKAPATPKAKKTANPKARSAVEKKGGAKGKGKKVKSEDDDNDDEEEQIKEDVKDGTDGEDEE